MPSRLLADLLDLVLPAVCAGCATPGPAWCARCAAGVGPPRLVGGLPGLPPTVAVGGYYGPLRRALLEYKERGRRALVAPLAGMLAEAVLAGGLAGRRCWLVPAPSRPSAVRARGGDHVRALVEALAERLAAGRSVGVSPALRMRGGGRDSVGLGALARAANLHGRLVARTDGLPPAGTGVLLVDDVVTTGATLRACVTALSAVGVTVSGATTLCDATCSLWRSGRSAVRQRREPHHPSGPRPFGEPFR